MSQDTNEVENQKLPDQLELLKKRAQMLNIKYHHNIGIAKLSALIEAQIGTTEKEAPVVTAPVQIGDKMDPFVPSKRETKAQTRLRLRREANELVRVRITCMDPNKKAWEGEFFTVSNSVAGTVTKYIQYNSAEGYHVPRIILEHMREKKCQIFSKKRGPMGMNTSEGKLIKAFAIEVLDALTPTEMKALANQQAMVSNTNNA